MRKTEKPILNVLQGEKPKRVPIWLMRQAGRYLPEYRNLRAKSKGFLNMCLDPVSAAEITLQPIDRFCFDAAILFADILLIPYALGQSLEFREGEGPVLQTVANEADIARLVYANDKLAPVYETLTRVKAKLNNETALIGFCGAPWTVACYMLDGNSHHDFAQAKEWMRVRPESLEKLFDVLIEASDAYLTHQIEAGAEVLQIFDSWAGLPKGEDFKRFVIVPTQKLVARLKRKYPDVPIIGFPREAGEHYEDYIKQTGVDALSIDQHVELDRAKKSLQKIKPLQGNLDPELLVKGGEPMLRGVQDILEKLGPMHIVNLGHGVVPQTPLENVQALVDAVRNYKIA